jgi:hypothetical protein
VSSIESVIYNIRENRQVEKCSLSSNLLILDTFIYFAIYGSPPPIFLFLAPVLCQTS